MARPYDIIVWGSTGFTGQLACKYLQTNYTTLKFAMAGRNLNKLEDLKTKLGIRSDVPILTADLNNKDELDRIIGQGRVLLTTAGPYAKIGSNIVESCIRCKTDYCDITGEAQWIKSIIDTYDQQAKANGVRIVNCCGFDCIPCDIGCYLIVKEMEKQNLTPVSARFLSDDSLGGVSGGTVASIMNVIESSSWKKLEELGNPFYLVTNDPIKDGIPRSIVKLGSDKYTSEFDKVFKKWTMPYIMQSIDTRIVNRSNAISGWSYGKSFLYDERMIAPGRISAFIASVIFRFVGVLIVIPFTRSLLKLILPAPGQGPSENILKTGYFTAKLWGKGIDKTTKMPKTVFGRIEARNGDPGYAQTAKMVAESAMCLAFDKLECPTTSGILTPSVAFGGKIAERLQKKGIFFTIEDLHSGKLI